MQDRPVCFQCKERVETDVIYEAPCGHAQCSSACFHPLCLMEFRERRENATNRFEVVAVLVRPWMREHTENEEVS